MFAWCWIKGGELTCLVVEQLDVGEPPSTIKPTYAGRYPVLLGDSSLGDGIPDHLPILVGSAWIEQSILASSAASPRLSFWYCIVTCNMAQDALWQFWAIFVLEINGELVF